MVRRRNPGHRPGGRGGGQNSASACHAGFPFWVSTDLAKLGTICFFFLGVGGGGEVAQELKTMNGNQTPSDPEFKTRRLRAVG